MNDPTLPQGPNLERLLEDVETAMYDAWYGALPDALAAEAGIESRREGGALRLTARGFDHPFFNRVMRYAMDGTDPEAALEDTLHHYEAADIRRWMVQVLPHVESEAFRAACAKRGVVRLRGWAKHVGRASLDVPAHTELRIEAVGDRSRAWAAIVLETFGFPEAFHAWLARLAELDGWRLYLALDGTEPAAAAALYVGTGDAGPRIGQLTFAGTLPRYRGRGAQSALAARRILDAREMGVDWIVTETDEELPDRPNPSYRNMVRLGLGVRYVRANWGPPKRQASD
jgi:ribosomal protein S18 acetylase RimI-like enzyme